VPMELTSLGRAYLAAAPEPKRKALLALFRKRRKGQWPALAEEIELAMQSVWQRGYCAAAWQPEVVALAVPLRWEGQPRYALNLSVSTAETVRSVEQELSGALLALAADIEGALAKQA
jgi:DNA-binding IclR family transcriptional regulator